MFDSNTEQGKDGLCILRASDTVNQPFHLNNIIIYKKFICETTELK